MDLQLLHLYSKSYKMPTAPLTPNPTLARLSATTGAAEVEPPAPPLLTLTRLKLARKAALIQVPKCKKTSNNHPLNSLYFQQLTDLSVQLASVFRHLSSDYVNVTTYNKTDTLLAQTLLKRDVKVYCKRIATGSA